MKAHIFAEGSNTTADDQTKPAKEYFQGLFRPVAGLNNDLTEFVDTHLHVLSEEYGLVNGRQPILEAPDPPQSKEGAVDLEQQARTEFVTAASEADVMVILLSTNTFENTAGKVWNEITDNAKAESIWCIGAARTTLDGLDFGKLENKGCTILNYQRRGVARIGTDIREEMVEAVREKAKK